MSPLSVAQMYATLLDAYGPQGWWPLLDVAGSNPTATGSITGYHPGVYDYPRSPAQRFEICVGAILTQNTAWSNVETALNALRHGIGLRPRAILEASPSGLESAIRSSGYFRVKARKLREFSETFLTFGQRVPSREQLLRVWGVGPETADSIRLYAYGQPEMVVDAYTRRILVHLGMTGTETTYADLKAVCAAGLPGDVVVYQEFHALLVEHAKRRYRRQPYTDPVLGADGAV